MDGNVGNCVELRPERGGIIRPFLKKRTNGEGQTGKWGRLGRKMGKVR